MSEKVIGAGVGMIPFAKTALGATGLAQCHELTHQLRVSAEQRQVEGARLALAHNVGLGGPGLPVPRGALHRWVRAAAPTPSPA